jgi:hypothetical protein
MKPRYIQFLGKDQPIYFGTNAINQWQRKQEAKDMTELEVTAAMIQVALAEGARKEGIKNAQKYSYEEIFDGMDEMGEAGLTQLTEAIASFMPTKSTQEGEESLGEASADQ